MSLLLTYKELRGGRGQQMLTSCKWPREEGRRRRRRRKDVFQQEGERDTLNLALSFLCCVKLSNAANAAIFLLDVRRAQQQQQQPPRLTTLTRSSCSEIVITNSFFLIYFCEVRFCCSSITVCIYVSKYA